ncbi:MAG: hypothetical protein AAB400_01630 [Patescibacteria group bacterium]
MLEVFVIIGIAIGVLAGWSATERESSDVIRCITTISIGICGGALFYGIGWLIGAIINAVTSFIAIYWLPIAAILAFIAGITYWVTHPNEVENFVLEAAMLAKEQFEKLVASIKTSDRVILGYARRQTKLLVGIAPEFEWHDIRTSVNSLGNSHIPNLLRERQDLRKAVKRVQHVLKQVEWQKPDRQDFEKANARRTAQNIEGLVIRLQRNEVDIKEALDTLCHLEADLAVATTDSYKRDEIMAQLHMLVSRIEQNSAAIQEARSETDDYAQGRTARRLTE